jgi:biotin carboxyl carrier protein
MTQDTVNDKKFEITSTEECFLMDGQPLEWDILKISERYFHILYQNKTYRAEWIKSDSETKTFTFKVNGNVYVVALKEKLDLMLEKMGIANGSASKINNVKAPMPGLIIDLKVKAGDVVKAGEPLLILEAMKMENILKSSREGVIKNVKVKKGESVEKGQVLLEF